MIAPNTPLLEDNRNVGLLVAGAGTTSETTDIVVRGTRERRSDGTFGRGIVVQDGPHAALIRALVEDNREHGIVATGAGTLVEASDLTVRDSLPRSMDAALGVGVWAQNGAHMVIAGARIERSHFVGLGSINGASVEARDLVVSGVEASHCYPKTCTGDTGGFGLVAIFGGTLTVTRFTVENATLCGVLAGLDSVRPTGLDLESGVIDRAMVGACVQQDGYDASRLQNGVEYRDVGVPLRATSYELPSSLEGL